MEDVKIVYLTSSSMSSMSSLGKYQSDWEWAPIRKLIPFYGKRDKEVDADVGRAQWCSAAMDTYLQQQCQQGDGGKNGKEERKYLNHVLSMAKQRAGYEDTSTNMDTDTDTGTILISSTSAKIKETETEKLKSKVTSKSSHTLNISFGSDSGSGSGFDGTASKLASRANRFSGQGGLTDASNVTDSYCCEARKSELYFLSKVDKMKECLSAEDLKPILLSLNSRLTNLKKKVQPGSKPSKTQKYVKCLFSLCAKGEDMERDDICEVILDINKELVEMEGMDDATSTANHCGADTPARDIKIEDDTMTETLASASRKRNIKIEDDTMTETPVSASRKRTRANISPSISLN